MRCAHCRASASDVRDPNELSTQEIKIPIQGDIKKQLRLSGPF
ncbi:MAG: hypothetical protein HY929_08330 [Euryarchaeota archaeon]|nr:hypothetical protein [Euryarchaeota archaeon]